MPETSMNIGTTLAIANEFEVQMDSMDNAEKRRWKKKNEKKQ